MTFGEKVKNLRKNRGLNQTQLADAVGVSLRTVRGWEIEGRYPKKHDLYQKLADILSCDISYLMTEEEAFITEASEQFGNRGAKQAQQILEQAAAMFAGGELSDEDKTAFMDEIQSLYLDSKRRAKKIYTKEIFRCQIDGVIIGQPIGYSFIVRSNIIRFCLIHTRGDIFGEFIYLQQSRKTCKKSSRPGILLKYWKK